MLDVFLLCPQTTSGHRCENIKTTNLIKTQIHITLFLTGRPAVKVFCINPFEKVPSTLVMSEQQHDRQETLCLAVSVHTHPEVTIKTGMPNARLVIWRLFVAVNIVHVYHGRGQDEDKYSSLHSGITIELAPAAASQLYLLYEYLTHWH